MVQDALRPQKRRPQAVGFPNDPAAFYLSGRQDLKRPEGVPASLGEALVPLCSDDPQTDAIPPIGTDRGHRVTLDVSDPVAGALCGAAEGWANTQNRRALRRALLDVLRQIEDDADTAESLITVEYVADAADDEAGKGGGR